MKSIQQGARRLLDVKVDRCERIADKDERRCFAQLVGVTVIDVHVGAIEKDRGEGIDRFSEFRLTERVPGPAQRCPRDQSRGDGAAGGRAGPNG